MSATLRKTWRMPQIPHLPKIPEHIQLPGSRPRAQTAEKRRQKRLRYLQASKVKRIESMKILSNAIRPFRSEPSLYERSHSANNVYAFT